MKDAQNILDDAFDVSDAVEGSAAEPLTPEAPPEVADGATEAADATPAEATPPATPDPETPPAQQPHMVPVDVVAELRERLRRAEEAAGARHAPPQAPPQPEPEEVPDPVEDPEGFKAWQDGQIEAIRWQSVSQLSLHMANQVHGEGVAFDAAKAYLSEAHRRGPVEGRMMMQRLRQQEHPYDYCIQWRDRQQMLSTLNPDQYRAFLAWQQGQTAQPGSPPVAPTATAAAPAAPATSTAPPATQRPPVIADAPSAGGVATTADVAPLDAVFPE